MTQNEANFKLLKSTTNDIYNEANRKGTTLSQAEAQAISDKYHNVWNEATGTLRFGGTKAGTYLGDHGYVGSRRPYIISSRFK